MLIEHTALCWQVHYKLCKCESHKLGEYWNYNILLFSRENHIIRTRCLAPATGCLNIAKKLCIFGTFLFASMSIVAVLLSLSSITSLSVITGVASPSPWTLVLFKRQMWQIRNQMWQMRPQISSDWSHFPTSAPCASPRCGMRRVNTTQNIRFPAKSGVRTQNTSSSTSETHILNKGKMSQAITSFDSFGIRTIVAT